MSKLYWWERDCDEHRREENWARWNKENPRGTEWRENYLYDLECKRMLDYDM